MNAIGKIKKASSFAEYARTYLRYVRNLLEHLDVNTLEQIARRIARARQEGRMVFLVGNGGSAATATHFAQDLALGVRPRGMRRFRTICLAESVSRITALGNDRNYEEIFTGQMESLFEKNDVLIAFSASGNSANILRAIRYANELGGITLGIVGFDGGKMKELCQVCLHIPTGKGEYGPVEGVHACVAHLLANHLASVSQ